MTGIDYTGKRILARDGSVEGTVTNAGRRCRLEGCGGVRLSTRWDNGRRTYPCSKGVDELPDGRLQIL
jgi:hypothetical protein